MQVLDIPGSMAREWLEDNLLDSTWAAKRKALTLSRLELSYIVSIRD